MSFGRTPCKETSHYPPESPRDVHTSVGNHLQGRFLFVLCFSGKRQESSLTDCGGWLVEGRMCVCHQVHTMEQQAVLKCTRVWLGNYRERMGGKECVYFFHLLSPRSQTPSTLQEANLSEKLRTKAKSVHCSCRDPEFGS